MEGFEDATRELSRHHPGADPLMHAADEVHDGRQYWLLDVEYCHFCKHAAVWRVFETNDSLAEQMYVCDAHKYTAFS